MDLTPIFERIQNTPIPFAVRQSRVLVALVEIVHLLGLTLFAGTILMVDLSLAGLGMRRHPAPRIAVELAPWTLGGLAVLMITGPILFMTEAVKCYDHPSFAIKMLLLIIALTIHFTIHRRVATAEPPATASRARTTAFLSLAAWTSVALTAKIFGS
jgi:hypothetical protein